MSGRLRWPLWIEIAALAVLTALPILFLAAGENNGIGYFQAPANNLYWPLAIGGAVNFIVFAWLVWVGFPAWRRSGSLKIAVLAAAVLIAGNVAIHTLIQLALIAWREPGLADVGAAALARENVPIAILLPLAALLYRGLRDWFLRRDPVPAAIREARVAFGSDANPVLIDPAGIRCIAAQGNYIEIDLGDRRRQVIGTLASTAGKLPPDRFVRVHRSWLVNLDHVERLSRTAARIGDRDVPVGERYAEQALSVWRQRTSAVPGTKP